MIKGASAPFFIENCKDSLIASKGMYSALYFTDLHHGTDFISKDDSSASTLGTQAHCTLKHVFDYAEQHGRMTIIHGGDENSIGADAFAENFRATELLLTGYAGQLIRVSGNHDPRPQTKMAENSIAAESHSLQVAENVSVIVLQPKLYENPARAGQQIYHYNGVDEDLVAQTLKERPDDFIILASHWGLDRQTRGYPALYDKNKYYGYEIRTDSILVQLKERPHGSVINIAGHEHRFSLNDKAGIPTLILPAFTQVDMDDPTKAAALFARLTIDRKGKEYSLSIDYKKAASPTCASVDMPYMERYYRPYKPY